MESYHTAIERSRIRRINWKKILGKSMAKYIKEGNFLNEEDIVVNILMKCRKDENQKYLEGWDWLDVVKNVEIGVSARKAELKIYGVTK